MVTTAAINDSPVAATAVEQTLLSSDTLYVIQPHGPIPTSIVTGIGDGLDCRIEASSSTSYKG